MPETFNLNLIIEYITKIAVFLEKLSIFILSNFKINPPKCPHSRRVGLVIFRAAYLQTKLDFAKD